MLTRELGRIDAETLRRLSHCGIESIEDLLRWAPEPARPSEFRQCSLRLGLAPVEFLSLFERARLRSIDGIGSIEELLLESAGIATIIDLAQSDPGVLELRLRALNACYSLTRHSPDQPRLERWVDEARRLLSPSETVAAGRGAELSCGRPAG